MTPNLSREQVYGLSISSSIDPFSRRAFEEANLYAMRETASELKQLIAGQVGLTYE